LTRGDKTVVDKRFGDMRDVIKAIKAWIRQFVKSKLPILSIYVDTFHLTDDRQVLEKAIFPYLIARPELQRVLFIGCEWYTKHYELIFRNKEYWTLEIDPSKRKYGGKHHIIDALKNLSLYVEPNYFDLIVCNGVFLVTAIDTYEEAEPSFESCFQHLRSGGLFLLGWNDTPELCPYPLEESSTLKKFHPYIFPPLSAIQYYTDTPQRHVYNFYTRP
jgi:SAM-dependent methyltransferase